MWERPYEVSENLIRSGTIITSKNPNQQPPGTNSKKSQKKCPGSTGAAKDFQEVSSCELAHSLPFGINRLHRRFFMANLQRQNLLNLGKDNDAGPYAKDGMKPIERKALGFDFHLVFWGLNKHGHVVKFRVLLGVCSFGLM